MGCEGVYGRCEIWRRITRESLIVANDEGLQMDGTRNRTRKAHGADRGPKKRQYLARQVVLHRIAFTLTVNYPCRHLEHRTASDLVLQLESPYIVNTNAPTQQLPTFMAPISAYNPKVRPYWVSPNQRITWSHPRLPFSSQKRSNCREFKHHLPIRKPSHELGRIVLSISASELAFTTSETVCSRWRCL